MNDDARGARDPLDAVGLSLRAGACEIALVRHADAVPDDGAPPVDPAYDAQPLSGRGRRQAAAVAERFADIAIAAVYASPVRRALETAEPLARRAGFDVRADPALVEVGIGALPDAGGVRAHLTALAEIALREGTWSTIAGTEPSSEVRRRMLAALDGIARAHAGERAVVVSHAGAINAALAAMLGAARDFPFPLANASVSTVRITAGRRLVMSANETAHLRGVNAPARA